MAGGVDGAVRVAPPVFILSVWVEETVVRLRQLQCMEVPRSENPHSAVLAWARARDRDSDHWGQAFEWSAARQARAADRDLRRWRVDQDSAWLDQGFYRQRRRARQELKAHGIFTAEDWLIDLTAQLKSGGTLPVELPREIVLEAFVEFTSLEEALLEALEGRGVEVRRPEARIEPSTVRVLGFPAPEDEWQAAASWAKSKMASGAGTVCVVLPPGVTSSGPSSRRVCQVFSAVFHPAAAAGLDDAAIRDFHIPAAGSLAQAGAVIDALLLIRLASTGSRKKIDFPLLSQWLLSGHWGGSDLEAVARARLERRLRDRGLFRLSLLETCSSARAAGLDQELAMLIGRVEGLPPPSPPAEAGAWINSVLRHWGWPGPACGARITAQVDLLEALLERLDGMSFASIDEAIALLSKMCTETVLPFGGGPLSPIQVLAPEVAAAGAFDAVWVCNLDNADWPPPIAMNPYLPAAARAVIPRMHPEGHLAYYERLTEMLCAAAPEVRLSWSRDAGEGPRDMSGLIAGFAAEESGEMAAIRLAREIWPAAGEQPASIGAVVLEAIDDPCGLPYPTDGEIDLPGGAGFFQLQAACPLLAYLQYRLAARFPPMPSPLASPQYRGELMHAAMRELYSRARGARGLPGGGDVGPAVDAALERLRARERLTATGLQAEAGRLRRALGEWLELDAGRQGFSVESLEAPFACRMGRAALDIRVDRVDRLSDGRWFLIDYKSGKGGNSRALKWGRSRMQEPQLPLYAVLLEVGGQGETGGLAFAVVKPGECAFDGISDDPGSSAQGIRLAGQGRWTLAFPDWASLLGHWRAQTELLLGEILEGCSENRVYDADAIRYSDLRLILRHEQTAESAEEGGVGDGF